MDTVLATLAAVPVERLALLLVSLAAAGLFAGLIGGLFGVGGGTVLVPVLFGLFTLTNPNSDSTLHVAVGTSLSTIIATSLRSVAAHRAKGAVDEAVLAGFIPWVGLGAILGAALAGFADRSVLGVVYGVLAALIGLYYTLVGPAVRLMADVPIGAARAGAGTMIGAASAMMGIGGGAFGSTMMTLAGRPIHQAVATAAGFGVAIAIPATIGFAVAGWARADLPPLSLGYVNVPGALLLAALTSASAPWGATLAHRLDRSLLRRLFGLWLLASAAVVAGGAAGWRDQGLAQAGVLRPVRCVPPANWARNRVRTGTCRSGQTRLPATCVGGQRSGCLRVGTMGKLHAASD